MSTLRVSSLLRFALRLDAIATAVTGALMLFFSTDLEALLQLPATLLAGAGAFCLLYAMVVWTLAQREALPRWAVWTVIVGNALWAIDCAALSFIGLVSPSTLGIGFLLMQAVVVAGFAELQYVGLRRSALT